jgi:hypothetical protein
VESIEPHDTKIDTSRRPHYRDLVILFLVLFYVQPRAIFQKANSFIFFIETLSKVVLSEMINENK